MNTEAQKQTDTLFGVRTFTVVHEDGSTEEIKIRQLRVFEYERALPFLKDEFALTAFCCSRTSLTPPVNGTKEWIMGKPPEHTDALRPESYEELRAAVREVNERGFFSFAARHEEEERKAKQEIVRSMAEMPPETLRAVSELAASGSRPLSPKPRPIPK